MVAHYLAKWTSKTNSKSFLLRAEVLTGIFLGGFNDEVMRLTVKLSRSHAERLAFEKILAVRVLIPIVDVEYMAPELSLPCEPF
jgi:hypothetical protein